MEHIDVPSPLNLAKMFTSCYYPVKIPLNLCVNY